MYTRETEEISDFYNTLTTTHTNEIVETYANGKLRLFGKILEFNENRPIELIDFE